MESSSETVLALLIHDLRSPLVAILYNSQLLSDDAELSEHQREIARDLLSAAQVLHRTVCNVSDLRRKEQGNLLLRPVEVDLDALLRHVAGLLSKRAGERRQTFDVQCEAGLRISTDRDLLRGLLETYGDVSMRHASSGSKITLAARREKGHVELSLADARESQRVQNPPSLAQMYCEVAAEVLGMTVRTEPLNPVGLRTILTFGPPK